MFMNPDYYLCIYSVIHLCAIFNYSCVKHVQLSEVSAVSNI